MEDRGERGRPAAAGRDDLLLAAVARAARHGPGRAAGAHLWEVLAHLDVPRRSWRARAVRERALALERAGRLRRGTAHGLAAWTLTAAGEQRLALLEAAGGAPRLPESPQHRAWRSARAAAAQELPRFQRALEQGLALAELMLSAGRAEGPEAPGSDAWLELAQRLRGDCRRLGSAWHCLHEWPEPSDDAPDRDVPAAGEPLPDRLRALRAGRRNVRLWSLPD